MSFDPNKFAEDLLKEAKVDDATRRSLLSTFADPAVSKKLAEYESGYMRQSDYSRKQAEAQEALKKAESWYNELNVWHTNKQADFQAREQSIKAGGNGTSLDNLNDETAQLSKKDIEEMLAKQFQAREQDELALVAALNSISFDHYKQFGEPLDTAALIKKATADRTNVQIAYERHIQPKLAEKANKDLEERIVRERAEAAREALANANIPSVGSLASLSGSFIHPTDGLKSDRAPEFGWRQAAKAHTDAILSGKRISGDEGF